MVFISTFCHQCTFCFVLASQKTRCLLSYPRASCSWAIHNRFFCQSSQCQVSSLKIFKLLSISIKYLLIFLIEVNLLRIISISVFKYMPQFPKKKNSYLCPLFLCLFLPGCEIFFSFSSSSSPVTPWVRTPAPAPGWRSWMWLSSWSLHSHWNSAASR